MKRVVLFAVVVTLSASLACGGSTQHTPVQEVPIDQSGGGRTSDLPPDEVEAGATTAVAYPDGSAPPGVGPQSLDGPQDAGAATATNASFVQRPGGLTQRECTDVIMKLATLMTKENHIPPPSQGDLAQHPIFGQMLTECSKSSTKKQHKCAMASTTMSAWKKCME